MFRLDTRMSSQEHFAFVSIKITLTETPVILKFIWLVIQQWKMLDLVTQFPVGSSASIRLEGTVSGLPKIYFDVFMTYLRGFVSELWQVTTDGKKCVSQLAWNYDQSSPPQLQRENLYGIYIFNSKRVSEDRNKPAMIVKKWKMGENVHLNISLLIFLFLF